MIIYKCGSFPGISERANVQNVDFHSFVVALVSLLVAALISWHIFFCISTFMAVNAMGHTPTLWRNFLELFLSSNKFALDSLSDQQSGFFFRLSTIFYLVKKAHFETKSSTKGLKPVFVQALEIPWMRIHGLFTSGLPIHMIHLVTGTFGWMMV